jgi:hypothetical protein
MQGLLYKFCGERMQDTGKHDQHVMLHCTAACDEAFDGFAQYARGALKWDPDLLYLSEFWNLHKDELQVPTVKKPKNGSAMFRWQQSQVAAKFAKRAVRLACSPPFRQALTQRKKERKKLRLPRAGVS